LKKKNLVKKSKFKAFKILDPGNTGFVDLRRLITILSNHVGPLTEDDLEVIMRSCDLDRDGNIGLEGSF